MGFKTIDWVYSLEDYFNGTEQSILVAYAYHRNEKTGACHPDKETVAKKARFSKRAVERAAKLFVELGLFEESGRDNFEWNLDWRPPKNRDRQSQEKRLTVAMNDSQSQEKRQTVAKTSDSQSQKNDSQSQICDSQSQKNDSQSHHSYIEPQINLNRTSNEPQGADAPLPVQDCLDDFSDGEDVEPDCGQFELTPPEQPPEEKPKTPPKRKPTLETISVDDVADWISQQRALGKLIEVDEHEALEEFKDYWRSKGKRHKDNVAAFRNWLRKAEKFDNDRKGNYHDKRTGSTGVPAATDCFGRRISATGEATSESILAHLEATRPQDDAGLSGSDEEEREWGNVIDLEGTESDDTYGGIAGLLSA